MGKHELYREIKGIYHTLGRIYGEVLIDLEMSLFFPNTLVKVEHFLRRRLEWREEGGVQ